MTTNISARPFQLTINGIDRTANFISINLSQNELADGGVLTNGTITLQANYSEIVDFTYLSSPSIAENWARGASVIYQIANDSGVLTNFLMSGAALYILKEPAPPNANYQITLEIGDSATLRNYRTADTDASGITAGVSTARNTVIERYLDASGVNKSISSIPYPFAFPQPKTEGNSLVDVAGRMARSAGHILYTNPSGTLVNKAIDFDAAEIATFTVGSDEKLFEQVDGSGIETPVDELVISGLATDIDASSYPRSTVNEVYGAILSYVRISLSSLELRNIRYLATRTTVTDYGWNGAEERIVTYIEKSILYISFIDILISNPSAFLIGSTEQTLTKRYDNKNRLIYEKEENDYFELIKVFDTQLGLTTARFSRPIYTTERRPATDIVTTYQYSDTDVLLSKRTETTNYVFLGGLKESAVYTLLAKEESWNNGLYNVQNFFKASSLNTVFESNRIFIRAALAESWTPSTGERIYATDGSTKPPATTYRKPFEPIERQVTATVKSIPFAGESFYSRSRPIDVNYLESQAQATDYGNTYLRLLYGRKQGFVFATAINNTLLTSLSPLSKVSIIWRGITYDCLTDGLTWVHTQTEMILGMRLIVIAANAVKAIGVTALIEAKLTQSALINCEIIGDQFLGGTFSQSGLISCFVQSGIVIEARFTQSATLTANVQANVSGLFTQSATLRLSIASNLPSITLSQNGIITCTVSG